MMNDMNSETHSWTVSLESLAILAFSGRLFFIIRAMLAMGRYRSCGCDDGDVSSRERETIEIERQEWLDSDLVKVRLSPQSIIQTQPIIRVMHLL